MIQDASLFLDLDGTLVDLIDQPDQVIANPALRDLLSEIAAKIDGRLAIVSGRSLAQLDEILGEITSKLALSGSHGSEHRWRGISAQPIRPQSLDSAAQSLRRFVAGIPGALVEEKSYGVTLHYRMAPAAEQEARLVAARLAEELELSLQGGKMMIELRPPGGGKGVAVRRLMSCPPMKGTTPIFVGDDVTDEEGFEAARELGGYGILVGPYRKTAASYGLPGPAAAREWLSDALK